MNSRPFSKITFFSFVISNLFHVVLFAAPMNWFDLAQKSSDFIEVEVLASVPKTVESKPKRGIEPSQRDQKVSKKKKSNSVHAAQSGKKTSGSLGTDAPTAQQQYNNYLANIYFSFSDKLRASGFKGRGKATVKLKITADGTLDDFEVTTDNKNSKMRKKLLSALKGIAKVDAPPANLKLPISIQFPVQFE